TLIRPFIYVEEKYLSGLARRYNLPIIHNPCPQDKNTKREDVKKLVESLDEKYSCKQLMLSALFHPERNNLWDKIKGIINTNNKE
ncbi:MAG: tRNA 2-thiocytidine(32) synthetase TtcA, partial [Clostridia bacterium]|nr:tRNA 2-thiocytidine(32) synthetase TtcA [Clostridia bacterium]